MMKVLCMKFERSSIQRLYVYTGWQSLSQLSLSQLVNAGIYVTKSRNITLLGLTDNSMPNHCFPPLC